MNDTHNRKKIVQNPLFGDFNAVGVTRCSPSAVSPAGTAVKRIKNRKQMLALLLKAMDAYNSECPGSRRVNLYFRGVMDFPSFEEYCNMIGVKVHRDVKTDVVFVRIPVLNCGVYFEWKDYPFY